MRKSKKKLLPKEIVLSAFILTCCVFIGAILFNYALDFVRWNKIANVISDNAISTKAAFLEWQLIEKNCHLLNEKFIEIKKKVRRIGSDLATYSKFSLFKKKDFDYLKRSYVLEQIKLYLLLKKLNRKCASNLIPIFFFYEIDDRPSERQGFVLEDFSKDNENATIVFVFDKDYSDEPLIDFFKEKFNVDNAPTIVLGDEKFEGFTYFGTLNGSLHRQLWKPDFEFTLKATGMPKETLIKALEANKDSDSKLIIERLQGFQSCVKIDWSSKNEEEEAIIYELLGALECENRQSFLKKAGKLWAKNNLTWRANILNSLSNFEKPQLKIEPFEIEPKNFTYPKNWSKIIIGKSKIVLNANDKVLIQVDRVTRDWLSGQLQSPWSNNFLTVFSEKFFYNESELLPRIGWHEGAIAKELSGVGIKILPATATMAARLGNRWFASDENGIFRFEIPKDKLLYPTTRFLSSEIAILIDTHGVNMLVEQAIRGKVNAVISDCDHPAKVAAAAWLSNEGIKVVCIPDRYAFLAFGHGLNFIAGAPYEIRGKKVVFGDRPIEIYRNETIIVLNASEDKKGLWYYNGPTLYFKTLNRLIPELKVKYVNIEDFNSMELLTKVAEISKSKIIAARVFNSNDYHALKAWLLKDGANRLILFHSMSYPYGKKLFNEFPNQTSFGDTKIYFE